MGLIQTSSSYPKLHFWFHLGSFKQFSWKRFLSIGIGPQPKFLVFCGAAGPRISLPSFSFMNAKTRDEVQTERQAQRKATVEHLTSRRKRRKRSARFKLFSALFFFPLSFSLPFYHKSCKFLCIISVQLLFTEKSVKIDQNVSCSAPWSPWCSPVATLATTRGKDGERRIVWDQVGDVMIRSTSRKLLSSWCATRQQVWSLCNLLLLKFSFFYTKTVRFSHYRRIP